MRQWELFGITDHEPWGGTISTPVLEADRTRWEFFWSTDAALNLRTVSGVATERLGLSARRCEGRELLDVFGMEGQNLALLEAHAEALGGNEGVFSIEGTDGVRIRCKVAPTHGADGRVIGTFCLAAAEEPDPDDREPESALRSWAA
jgi:PAS domain-containing protein